MECFFFYNFHELQVKCVRHAPIESSVCVDGACYALDFVHCRKKKSPSKEDMRPDIVI